MKETTQQLISNNINKQLEQLSSRGLVLTKREELFYRQGIAMGLTMSPMLFEDFSHEDIAKLVDLE